MVNENKRLARRISETMLGMQLTQKHLAAILQVTQPAISKYLQGRIPPPLVLLRLAQLSGRSMEWLLSGETSSVVPPAHISEKQALYGRTGSLADRIELLPPSLRGRISELVDSLLQELHPGH
jgi:transcriptional regulator with XRE-family HTH domain